MNLGAGRAIEVVRTAGAILYALFCGLAIMLLSARDYEWMVGERGADGAVTTLCTLPAAVDDTADVMIPLTALLIGGLLGPRLVRLGRHRRVGLSLALAAGLVIDGAYAFFGRPASC